MHVLKFFVSLQCQTIKIKEIMKAKLTKKQVKQLNSIMFRLSKFSEQFEGETDVELRIFENGTVYSNLNCALASLDTILQEY